MGIEVVSRDMVAVGEIISFTTSLERLGGDERFIFVSCGGCLDQTINGGGHRWIGVLVHCLLFIWFSSLFLSFVFE